MTCHVGRTQISRAVSYGWKGVTSLVFAACWLGEAMVLQECNDFHTGDKRLYLSANLALLGRCVIFSHEQSTCNPDDEAMSQTSEKAWFWVLPVLWHSFQIQVFVHLLVRRQSSRHEALLEAGFDHLG